MVLKRYKCSRSPTSRDNGLKNRKVWVQIPSRAPETVLLLVPFYNSFSSFVFGGLTATILGVRIIVVRLALTQEAEGQYLYSQPNQHERVSFIKAEDATKRLEMNPQALRLALQQGLFPFGCAIKTSKHRYAYKIFETRLEKYIKGEDMHEKSSYRFGNVDASNWLPSSSRFNR